MRLLAAGCSWLAVALLIAGCGSAKSGARSVKPVFKDSSIEGVGRGFVDDSEVIGPKRGPFEDAFMKSQESLYARFPCIERAYLVRAKHEGEANEVVALVIAPQKCQDEDLVGAIKEDLHRVSGGEPWLDILWADSEFEKKVSKKAEPFYRRPRA